MRLINCTALVLATIGSLHAQSPIHGNVNLYLSVPVGGFLETTYITPDVDVRQTEGYNIGFGGQLGIGFPLQKNVALRVVFSGMTTNGTNTATGYDTIYLRHAMFSLGADLQFFFDDAYRHKGTYIVTGISGDFERFERSFDDNRDWRWNSTYSEVDVSRKNRLGGTVGIGRTFYGSSLNFTLELSYHTTLTNKDFDRGEPLAANFIKLNFGTVF